MKNGLTVDELKTNIVSWKNARKTDLGTNNQLTSLSNNYLLNDISFDKYDELEKKIENLSIDQVNEVLRKNISLDGLTTIFSGSFNK